MRLKYLAILLLLTLVTLPVVAQNTPITPDNAANLKEVFRLGRGEPEDVQHIPGTDQTAVLTPLGVWLYDSNLSEPRLLSRQETSPGRGNLMAVHPAGTQLAVFERNLLTVWDVTSREVVRQLTDFPHTPRSLTYTPDGMSIIYGVDDGQLYTLALEDGSHTLVFEGHDEVVKHINFASQNNVLIVVHEDGIIRLLNASTYQSLKTLESHTDDITDAAVSPDGEVLATASDDETVRLWDVRGDSDFFGEEMAIIQDPDGRIRFEAVVFHPSLESYQLMTGNFSGMYLWNVDPNSSAYGQLIARIPFDGYRNIVALDYDSTASRLDVYTRSPVSLLHVDVNTSEITPATGHDTYAESLVFSPDSQSLIFGRANGRVYLWNMSLRPPVADVTELPDVEVDIFASSGESISYAPDGSFFTIVGRSSIYVMDAETVRLQYELDVNVSLEWVAVSPDSSLIAVSTHDGIQFFDSGSGDPVALIDAIPFTGSTVESMTFSPDQTMFVVASRDGAIRVLSVP